MILWEQLNIIHLSLFIFILLNNQIQVYNYVYMLVTFIMYTLYTRMHIIIIILL